MVQSDDVTEPCLQGAGPSSHKTSPAKQSADHGVDVPSCLKLSVRNPSVGPRQCRVTNTCSDMAFEVAHTCGRSVRYSVRCNSYYSVPVTLLF